MASSSVLYHGIRNESDNDADNDGIEDSIDLTPLGE